MNNQQPPINPANFPQRPTSFPTQQQTFQPNQQPVQQFTPRGPQPDMPLQQGMMQPPLQNFPTQQGQFPPIQPGQFPLPAPTNMPFPIPDLDKIQQRKLDNDNASDSGDDIIENLEQLPPGNTIYLNNLNERVKIDDMRESLQEVFEEYGTILQIIHKKNIKMRGQAFIVFQDIQAAIDAKEQMQGAKIYGKPMRINFARAKSDIISKADGTYQKREKTTTLSLKEQIEKQKENKQRLELEKREKQAQQQQQQQQQQQIQQQQQQTQKQPPRPQIVPHNILFIENLSPAVNQEALLEVFLQCNGFKEVRLIQTKRVAFVEFEDEFQAGIAMNSLIGTQILDCTLSISYAKK